MRLDDSTAPDMLPPSSPSATMSSPANPYLSPSRSRRRKEKRNPSVTPRRFGRFFTPRLSGPTGTRIALGPLGASAANRQPISPQSLAGDPLSSDPICPSSPTEGLSHGTHEKRKRAEHAQAAIKRRRDILNSATAPPPLRLPPPRSFHMSRDGDVSVVASPVEERDGLDFQRRATLSHFFKTSRSGSVTSLDDKSYSVAPSVQPSELRKCLAHQGYKPQPIRKLRNRGFESQLLDREHGFSSHVGRQDLAFPVADTRFSTASFYSHGQDLHHCTSSTGQTNNIPFSLASGHREQFTVIGDEEGYLRFFSTDPSWANDANVRHHFKVHDNAIMDVDISGDDLRVATACGDRSGKIVDTLTQTVACELSDNHWDSLRQVSFQPGQSQGDVLATSDRAGCVQIWDLRCSGKSAASFSAHGLRQRDVTLDMFQAKSVNTITNAHERTTQGTKSTASVTAIHWMPPGREHLLLTASEANAAIKLWDTRYIKPRRQAEETPLAVTMQPPSHAWRSYGITSLALSADAARLYAVCKDSTVYAYSTAHLMLGYAPELSDGAVKRRPTAASGLGPLYGLRNDMFRVQSFYIKCATRPSSNNSSKSQHSSTELLATGSSDSCAVLFPLDEPYLHSQCAKKAHELPSSSNNNNNPSTPVVQTPSGGAPSGSVPIFKCGTPLIRGHSREVTAISWSRDGVLVSASDDSIVRRWYGRNDGKARYLRQVGEFGGERHMAGWADVGADWDDDED